MHRLIFPFQLTASRGGWRKAIEKRCCRKTISTHSLTRRLTQVSTERKWNMRISTHSLTRRLTIIDSVFEELTTFQLTASRGGWRFPRVPTIPYLAISTHSLTRRLTRYWRSWYVHRWYFNSQPHEEADDIGRYYEHVPGAFQLTASRGGWHNITVKRSWWTYFNSQPHEEADLNALMFFSFIPVFQLTASRGGWRCDT